MTAATVTSRPASQIQGTNDDALVSVYWGQGVAAEPFSDSYWGDVCGYVQPSCGGKSGEYGLPTHLTVRQYLVGGAGRLLAG